MSAGPSPSQSTSLSTLLEGCATPSTSDIPSTPLSHLRTTAAAVFSLYAPTTTSDTPDADADAAFAAWLSSSPDFHVFTPSSLGLSWSSQAVPSDPPPSSLLWVLSTAHTPDLSSLSSSSSPSTPSSSPSSLRMFEAERNQYSIGAISSCTIMALESALRVLIGESLGLDLVESVLDVGAAYTSPAHLSADEVVATVPRYAACLTPGRMAGLMASTLGEAIPMLEDAVGQQASAVAAVVTKAPESIMIAALPAQDDPTRVASFLLFDSHPRDDHPGAAMIVMDSPAAIRGYLSSLFPTVDFGGEDMGIQGAMLNMADVTFFSLAPDFVASGSDIASLPLIADTTTTISQSVSSSVGGMGGGGSGDALEPVDPATLDPEMVAILQQYLEAQSLPTDFGFHTHADLARHLQNALAWYS